MSVESDIAELREKLERLAHDTVAPIRASLLQLRQSFTPSGYLDPQRLPQLTGDVTHFAGTEPVLVPLDRFEWISPTNGAGTQVCAIDQGQDVDIIDVTETGHVTGIGVVCSKSTGSAGAADVWLDITIDGGTTQSFQIAFAARIWGTAMQPYVSVGATPQSGDVAGHAMFIPMGLTYRSRLVVAWRSVVTTTFSADEWDLAATVLRGRLVAA